MPYSAVRCVLLFETSPEIASPVIPSSFVKHLGDSTNFLVTVNRPLTLNRC